MAWWLARCLSRIIEIGLKSSPGRIRMKISAPQLCQTTRETIVRLIEVIAGLSRYRDSCLERSCRPPTSSRPGTSQHRQNTNSSVIKMTISNIVSSVLIYHMAARIIVAVPLLLLPGFRLAVPDYMELDRSGTHFSRAILTRLRTKDNNRTEQRVIVPYSSASRMSFTR